MARQSLRTEVSYFRNRFTDLIEFDSRSIPARG